jgi:hypothetical protein
MPLDFRVWDKLDDDPTVAQAVKEEYDKFRNSQCDTFECIGCSFNVSPFLEGCDYPENTEIFFSPSSTTFIEFCDTCRSKPCAVCEKKQSNDQDRVPMYDRSLSPCDQVFNSYAKRVQLCCSLDCATQLSLKKTFLDQ